MSEGTVPAKSRRTALEVLSRDRLGAITEKFNLAVEDRRSQAAHVDAIVKARSLDFGEVLHQLSRDELKAVCNASGLDSSGKEKEGLVRRVLGSSAPPPTTNGRTNGEQLELSPAGVKLTVEQLEARLWRTANIQRGSIDSSGYKNGPGRPVSVL